jgi:hypothetical protein
MSDRGKRSNSLRSSLTGFAVEVAHWISICGRRITQSWEGAKDCVKNFRIDSLP